MRKPVQQANENVNSISITSQDLAVQKYSKYLPSLINRFLVKDYESAVITVSGRIVKGFKNVFAFSDIEKYLNGLAKYKDNVSTDGKKKNIVIKIQNESNNFPAYINFGKIAPFDKSNDSDIIVSANELISAYNTFKNTASAVPLTLDTLLAKLASPTDPDKAENNRFLLKLKKEQTIKIIVDNSSAPGVFNNGKPIDTAQLISLIKLFVEANSDSAGKFDLDANVKLDLTDAYILGLNMEELLNALSSRFPLDVNKFKFLSGRIKFPDDSCSPNDKTGKRLHGNVVFPSEMQILLSAADKEGSEIIAALNEDVKAEAIKVLPKLDNVKLNFNTTLSYLYAFENKKHEAKLAASTARLEKLNEAQKTAEAKLEKLADKIKEILKLPESASVFVVALTNSTADIKIRIGNSYVLIGQLTISNPVDAVSFSSSTIDQIISDSALKLGNKNLEWFSTMRSKRPDSSMLLNDSTVAKEKSQSGMYDHIFSEINKLIENKNQKEDMLKIDFLFRYIHKNKIVLNPSQITSIHPLFLRIKESKNRFSLSSCNALLLLKECSTENSEAVNNKNAAILIDNAGDEISMDNFIELVSRGFCQFHNLTITPATKPYDLAILEKIQHFSPANFAGCMITENASDRKVDMSSFVQLLLSNEGDHITSSDKRFLESLKKDTASKFSAKPTVTEKQLVSAYNKRNKESTVKNMIELMRQNNIQEFLFDFRIKVIVDTAIKMKARWTESEIAFLTHTSEHEFKDYRKIYFNDNFDFKNLISAITTPNHTVSLEKQLEFFVSFRLDGAKFDGVILPEFILNLLKDKEAAEKQLNGKIRGDALHEIFVEANEALLKSKENAFDEYLLPALKMNLKKFSLIQNSRSEEAEIQKPAIFARGIAVSGEAILTNPNTTPGARIDLRNAQFETLTVQVNGLLGGFGFAHLFKGIKANNLIVAQGVSLNIGKGFNPISLKNFTNVTYSAKLKSVGKENKTPLPVRIEIKGDGSITFSSNDRNFQVTKDILESFYKEIDTECKKIRKWGSFYNKIDTLDKTKPALSVAEKILSLMEYAQKNPDTTTNKALQKVLGERFNPTAVSTSVVQQPVFTGTNVANVANVVTDPITPARAADHALLRDLQCVEKIAVILELITVSKVDGPDQLMLTNIDGLKTALDDLIKHSSNNPILLNFATKLRSLADDQEIIQLQDVLKNVHAYFTKTMDELKSTALNGFVLVNDDSETLDDANSFMTTLISHSTLRKTEEGEITKLGSMLTDIETLLNDYANYLKAPVADDVNKLLDRVIVILKSISGLNVESKTMKLKESCNSLEPIKLTITSSNKPLTEMQNKLTEIKAAAQASVLAAAEAEAKANAAAAEKAIADAQEKADAERKAIADAQEKADAERKAVAEAKKTAARRQRELNLLKNDKITILHGFIDRGLVAPFSSMSEYNITVTVTNIMKSLNDLLSRYLTVETEPHFFVSPFGVNEKLLPQLNNKPEKNGLKAEFHTAIANLLVLEISRTEFLTKTDVDLDQHRQDMRKAIESVIEKAGRFCPDAKAAVEAAKPSQAAGNSASLFGSSGGTAPKVSPTNITPRGTPT
ncbi:MAG: cell envelope integrity protein TolA [Gammaproteobacteria bacterium]|nr:cell envelope integrity protein TolA [Gammaproteobacteria bacterium]